MYNTKKQQGRKNVEGRKHLTVPKKKSFFIIVSSMNPRTESKSDINTQ